MLTPSCDPQAATPHPQQNRAENLHAEPLDLGHVGFALFRSEHDWAFTVQPKNLGEAPTSEDLK